MNEPARTDTTHSLQIPERAQPLILVADDDPLLARALSHTLAQAGFATVVVERGDEAWRLFNEQLPDVVVCDVQMPGLDGFEVCRRIKAVDQYQDCCVLIMTALEDMSAIDAAFAAGATDFVGKPLQWALVKERVRFALRARDVQRALREQQQKLWYQEHYDPLTGLPNQTLFKQHLASALQTANERGLVLPLLFITLKRMEKAVEIEGQAGVDALCRQASERLARWCRTGFVARFEGNTFVALLPGQSDWNPDLLDHAANDLFHALSHPFDIAGQRFHLAVTIGLSIFPWDAEDATSLLSHASAAVAGHAHDNERGCFFYSAEISHRARERYWIENALRHAIARGELALHWQPQIHAQSGRLAGAEALLRWLHPERGFISPVLFIPIAEESELIFAIDQWVLAEACRLAGEWRQHHQLTMRVSVNLSARHFAQPGLVERVTAALAASGIEPWQLEIEITESATIEHLETTIERLRQLKQLGVRLAIDDFGTGYSSLSYLHRLPVDQLKIDRSFVTHMTQNPSNLSLAKAIIALGKSLELTVVAEGVETQEHAQLLTRHGCDELQGYHFAKPMPVAEFLSFVAGLGAATSDAGMPR